MKKLNFTPIGDYVVLMRDDSDQVTKGGIVIPDVAKQKPQRGKILAVGDGAVTEDGKLVNMTVKEGQRVLFESYGAGDFELDGETLTKVRERDIIGIIHN